jgi:hypothetical protein
MGPYRTNAEPNDTASRLAAWKRFAQRALAHRIALALLSVAVIARSVMPDHAPRLSILLAIAAALWTWRRAHDVSCPICGERILEQASSLRTLIGLFPDHCSACSAARGTLAGRRSQPEPAPDYRVRSEKRWRWVFRRVIFTTVTVAALYGIDRTGETVNVRGTMSRPTTAPLPFDAHDGRRASSTPVSRVYTEVGAFDWSAGDPGPVLVRVTIGRLTGLPYPVSVARAP